MSLTLIDGNEAIAQGALAAGCRFFAGYPITPATTIYNAMLRLLPPRGGVCLQGEDEIASIGFCLGASMAGFKVMTATSGPGISLYSEQISFAIGSEIPIVIVDVQRLGPSTGSATKGADGDLQFLRWGNSGGLPVIVLAPVDARDCFELTMAAFNLAETTRCPVFLASNKEVAMTRETLDWAALVRPPVVDRRPPTATGPGHPYLPFELEGDSLVPPFLPIGADQPVRQTSSTHGADGFITTDSKCIAANQERLRRKLESAVAEFSYWSELPAAAADTLVISYGVSARAARAAVLQEQRAGRAVALLVLKTLWPVPAELIRERARGCRRVLVVEMNLGQYVREIQRLLPDREITLIGRMDGELIRPAQVREAIAHG